MQAIESLLNKTLNIITKYDLIAKVTGENFNVFSILDVGASEVRLHSSLLAEILNPKGQHGQEMAFFKIFLESLKKLNLREEVNNCLDKFIDGTIVVEAEKWIGFIDNDYSKGGYIDIIIENNNGEAIIIENKIYAVDQKNQLRRYFNYNEKAIIIYLTLDGRTASDESTCNNSYPNEIITPICISYKSFVIDWLIECQKHAVNFPLIRETLQQYIYMLKKLTHQTTNNQMENDIVTLIANDPDNIRSAEEIWKNEEPIKQRIIKDLLEVLRNWAGSRNLIFEDNISNDSEKKEKWFCFYLEGNPFGVLYFFYNGYNNLEVGVDWVPNKINEKNKNLENKLKDHFKDFNLGNNPLSDEWIWGKEFTSWSTINWADVKTSMPEIIKNTTELFIEKLKLFK